MDEILSKVVFKNFKSRLSVAQQCHLVVGNRITILWEYCITNHFEIPNKDFSPTALLRQWLVIFVNV